jgi:flavin reductase (DIM6/NTAB) family NADH-FMN oxidoreductase RutF
VNIAPISWVSLVGGKPPRLVLCALNRHDTCRNLLAFGEFTVNIPHSGIQKKIASCAAELPPTSSENEMARFSLLASCHVDVPMIGECRSNLECVVAEATDIGNSTLFTCEVRAAYIDEGIEGNARAVFM